MVGQFIPIVFPIGSLLRFAISGLLISTLLFYVLFRLAGTHRKALKSRIKNGAIAISIIVVACCAFNFLSWRLTEFTMPTATDIRSLAHRHASRTEILRRLGEPEARQKSQSGKDTLIYTAIIKYSSGRWGIGTIGIELDSAGNAVETWTAD